MESFKFTVTISVEHPDEFTIDNSDLAKIVMLGVKRYNSSVGCIDVCANEEQ